MSARTLSSFKNNTSAWTLSTWSTMTEEQKDTSASENTDVESETNEESNSDESTEASEETTEDAPSQEQPDYKAQLEEERTRREKAENAIEKYKRKADEAQERGDDESSEDLIEKVRSVVREENNAVRSELYGDRVRQLTEDATSSKDEADLTEYYYNNLGNLKTGDLKRDIQRAKLLANESQLLNREGEISALQNAESGKSRAVTTAEKASQPAVEPKLSDSDRKMLSGYSWNAQKGQYEKEGAPFAMKVVDGELTQIRK